MEERERQRGNRNPPGQDDNDNDPIARVVRGLGSLAMLGGALWAATRIFSGGDQEESPQRSSTSTMANAGHQSQQNLTASSPFGALDYPRSGSESTITIAVDATPTRGGGLLVIPRREEVYFYSIDWSGYMTFGTEPDKFELMNALLAISIFDAYVSSYRRGGDEVVLKTDSTFCLSLDTAYRGQRNTAWKEFFSSVDSKLKGEPFYGKWGYAQKTADDCLRIADKLSRMDCSNYVALPAVAVGASGVEIMCCTQHNVSMGHGSLLQMIKEQVPKQGAVTVSSSQIEAQGGGDCQPT